MPSESEFGGVYLDAGCRNQVGASSDNVGNRESSSPLLGLRTASAAEGMPDELVKSRSESPSLASRYEALLRASRAISSYREPVALFRALAGELQHAVTFDYLGLFLYDESLNKIEMPVLHVVNGPGVAIPADLRAQETITWWVYHNQQPVVISHAPEESRFPRIMEIYKRCGVQSAVVLPVTTAHRRLGGLTLGSEQANAYSEEEIRYLELVADHVALAVDSVLRDEEQRSSEESLRKQKAHFERLFALAPEAIVLRDIENRVLRVNEEFTNLFGYTVDEALGRNISSLIVPDDQRDECEKLREVLKRGEKVNAETIRRRKDGKRLTVSFVAAPVSVEGNEREIYSIYRDITERKRAEERLRRSEAYLAEGQRLTHTGSWARCVSTGELYWSRESFLIFGLDPEGPSPTFKTLLSRIHPEDRDSAMDTIQDSIVRRSDFKIDYRIVLEDGTVRHIHVVGHPVINAAGQLNEFVGTHVDVTDQIQSRAALEKAFEEIQHLKDRLYQENVALREEIDETSMFEQIVGKSDALRRVLAQVETVATTDSTVLIYGETGTGKELIARAIHNLSERSAQAFVKLNCAAIPTGLLESELFGHERGAFTGAVGQRVGRFELANHGTVFLDEIGEIPLDLQPKLLRVLQEREFERLGSSRTLRTDARLIAATNSNLSAMVESGKFRSDLFYRLDVFPIHLPPLRDRKEDIPLLVRHFVQHFTRRMKKNVDSIPAATMTALCEYHWPGNIRELQNVIERAVIVSTGSVLQVSIGDLKPRNHTIGNHEKTGGVQMTDARNARRAFDESERKQILGVLAKTHWTVGGPDGAAARLGVKRSTLQYRMRKLGIPSKRENI
jgi:PAS domain S-box-containing protein